MVEFAPCMRPKEQKNTSKFSQRSGYKQSRLTIRHTMLETAENEHDNWKPHS